MMHRETRLRGLAVVACSLAVALSVSVAESSAEAAPGSARGGDLRVMTYNVGGDADLERIAAVIRAEAPDVVAVQELHRDDPGLPGSHGDQPSELAALLADDGFEYSYYQPAETIPWLRDDGAGAGCAVHAPGGGAGSGTTGTEADEATYSCGNLVLSKFEFPTDPSDPRGPEAVVLRTDNVDPGGRDRRVLLGLTVRVPGIGDVRVYNTHLIPPRTQRHVEDQKIQARTALDHVALATDGPVILAGDFNTRPSDAPTGPTANNLIHSWVAELGLVDTWTRVNDSGDGPTMTSALGRTDGQHPDRRIDYIYASPSFDVRGAHVSVVDPGASDHLAVVTDLSFRRPPMYSQATALAGPEGLSGWGQVAVDRGNRVSLTACKNVGTTTDDGTEVRVSLHHPSTAGAIWSVDDGGTSRDRCTSESFRARILSGTVLRACLVDGDQVLGCRSQPIGG